jgi:hypothetical protein
MSGEINESQFQHSFNTPEVSFLVKFINLIRKITVNSIVEQI